MSGLSKIKLQLLYVLFILISSFPLYRISALANSDIMKPSLSDERAGSFAIEFSKAFKAKNQKEISKLIRNNRLIIPEIIILLVNSGIKSIAEKNDDELFLTFAALIAEAYDNAFKKDLAGLVGFYLAYDRKICLQRKEINQLIDEGLHFYNLGEYKNALSKLEKALKKTHEINDFINMAYCFNNLAATYSRLGNYKKSLEYLKTAQMIFKEMDHWKEQARVDLNIGALHLELHNFEEGLHHFAAAQETFKKCGLVEDEAMVITNMGFAYLQLRKYNEAELHFQKALMLVRNQESLYVEAKVYIGLAGLYYHLGQSAKCLEYYQNALDIQRRRHDASGEAEALCNIGQLYSSINQYEIAKDRSKEALVIYRRIGESKSIAHTLIQLGNAQLKTGHILVAMSNYSEAQRIYRDIGDEFGEIDALIGEGLMLYSLKKYEDALKTLIVAADKAIQNDYQFRLPEIYTNIGYVFYKLGRLEKAQKNFQHAMDSPEMSLRPDIKWGTLSGIGLVKWKSGKGRQAVVYYEEAISIIEDLYQLTKGLKEEERLSMIGDKIDVYQNFIELLLELHRTYPNSGYDRQAFTVSEKNKSRMFLELMSIARAKINYSGDQQFNRFVSRERQLTFEIVHTRNRLSKQMTQPKNQRDSGVIVSLKEKMVAARQALSVLEKEMEATYPRFADLKRPRPISVEQLQAQLEPNETVLAYAVCSKKTLVFVIQKHHFKMEILTVDREQLRDTIRRFKKGLVNVKTIIGLEKFRPKIAHNLYQVLFEPIIPELNGSKRLYICADGILFTLPFEALIDKPIDQKKFRATKKRSKRNRVDYLTEYAVLHYLVDTYTIAYLPSASVLRTMRKFKKPGFGQWRKPLIAFADPVFSMEKVSGCLPRLKESAQEAEAIAQAVRGDKKDIYLRIDASESNVHLVNLHSARYLLFSTHGLLGGEFSHVTEPALALTLVGNPAGYDGFLTMNEVLGLDINADIVILSACNTSGQGDKAGRGEGFAGLTRSFMYAGAQSLLVTHWNVDSKAARDLMIETFENIKTRDKPEALRQAKIKMKNSWRDIDKNQHLKLSLSHPFFWAPFVLVGEIK
jgi:CHAT domain-containing protein/tetratricopeptide (TPR) repeat protein